MNSVARLSLFALSLGLTLPAWAASASTQLTLSTTVERQVANDQLDATLYLEQQQAQPAQLADGLNRASNQALASARQFEHVTVQSGAYSSWPEYDKDGKISGWRGRVEVRLKSTDLIQSAQLVAQLQQSMLLANVTFSVSEETRKRAQQQMLPAAIQQLQQTAQVTAQALGRHQVKVKALTIANSSAGMRPMMAMMANRSVSSPVAVTTPDWQAGESQLQVQVSGTLEVY